MLELNKIYHGDCLEIMKLIDNESIDLIVTDPPYFQCSKHDYDYVFSTKEDWLNWIINVSQCAFKLLKEGGSFYIFGGIGTRNGFIFWNYVEKLSELFTFCSYINWKRFRPKGYKGKHNNWGDCREDIAYFVKGKNPKTFHKQYMREAGLSSASKKRFEQTGIGLSCGNIWIDIPEAQLDGGLNRTLLHPDQKPVLLIERIVNASSNPGELILDMFAGSGTTGVASKNTNRNFILIEKEQKYIEVAKEMGIKEYVGKV